MNQFYKIYHNVDWLSLRRNEAASTNASNVINFTYNHNKIEEITVTIDVPIYLFYYETKFSVYFHDGFERYGVWKAATDRLHELLQPGNIIISQFGTLYASHSLAQLWVDPADALDMLSNL